MLGDQSPQHEAKKKLPGGEPSDEQQWLDAIKDLYYDPSGETAFGSYGKLLHKAKTFPGHSLAKSNRGMNSKTHILFTDQYESISQGTPMLSQIFWTSLKWTWLKFSPSLNMTITDIS